MTFPDTTTQDLTLLRPDPHRRPVFLARFPQQPHFESLLSGSRDVDWLAVSCEMTGCDDTAVAQWVGEQAGLVRQATGPFESTVSLATTTVATCGLNVTKDADAVRLCEVVTTGIGSTPAVGFLEWGVLRQLGLEATLIDVVGEWLLQVDAVDEPWFRIIGDAAVWQSTSEIERHLARRLGVSQQDVAGHLVPTQPRELFRRYLDSITGQDTLGPQTPLVCRGLAALEPSDSQRWVDLASAEVTHGHAATGFDLAARLERAGHQTASPVRRAAEAALAKWN